MHRTFLPFLATARFSIPLLLALGALPACSSDMEHPAEGSDAGLPPPPTVDLGSPPAAVACTPSVTVRLPLAVAELRSSAPFQIEVTIADSGGATEPHPLKAVLSTADGAPLKTLVDAPRPLGPVALEFTPAAEKELLTGALQLKVEVGCPASTPTSTDSTHATATATIYAVRLGATQLLVKDGEGGGRVPLMYHALNRRAANYFPIPATLPTSSLDIPDGEPELDKPDGTPRAFPAMPWADLATPPVDAQGAVIETGNTLPVSLLLGTRPALAFTLGKSAQRPGGTQSTGLAAKGLPAIRLVVDGTPGSDSALVTEGGQVTVQLATSPVPAIDRVDQLVTWHFEYAESAGKFAKIAGSEQSVTLRFYGVLGNDQGMAAPDLPWVAVVDDATAKIAGGASDALKARALLVQHIYEDLGLSYDRRAGASRYTQYQGEWVVGSFALSDFLKRSRGSVVNCSDCASILTTYANMVGAKLHYAIIGWNFKLNPILGIGATMFGSPFTSGRLQFSYHAVTTPDEAMTINDATLAVDGDSDPKSAPYTKQLVQNLTGDDYLTRLSPTFGTGTPVYQYNDQITHVR